MPFRPRSGSIGGLFQLIHDRAIVVFRPGFRSCDNGALLLIQALLPIRSCLINLTLTPRCERAVRASHAIGARRRSGARERV